MDIWLQTRGKTRDYAFIGARPPEQWWSAGACPYRDFTSFEQPSLILEGHGEGEGWRCFISGIPSVRRDCIGTPICYALALTGKQTQEDRQALRWLLTCALESFSDVPARHGALTELLDGAVDESKVDAWLKISHIQAGGVDHGGRHEEGDHPVDGSEVEDCMDILNKEINNKGISAEDISSSMAFRLEEFLFEKECPFKVVALLNFIACEDDSLMKDFEEDFGKARPDFSTGDVLLIPSPVAGGVIGDTLILPKFLGDEAGQAEIDRRLPGLPEPHDSSTGDVATGPRGKSVRGGNPNSSSRMVDRFLKGVKDVGGAVKNGGEAFMKTLRKLAP